MDSYGYLLSEDPWQYNKNVSGITVPGKMIMLCVVCAIWHVVKPQAYDKYLPVPSSKNNV